MPCSRLSQADYYDLIHKEYLSHSVSRCLV